MPRRCRVDVFRQAPSLCSIDEAVHSALAPDAVGILKAVGFYQSYGLEIPGETEPRELAGDERIAFEKIANLVAIVGHLAHREPPTVVKAWLTKIAKHPNDFHPDRLSDDVVGAFAANYCRGNERPGTHIQDVFGDEHIRFSTPVQTARPENIAEAAERALAHFPRRLGRAVNVANYRLAALLLREYQSFGGRVVRRQIPVDKKGGGVRYVEDGNFLHLVKRVIGPLNAHLAQHRLPPATAETIERIASKVS
jgi:hypothetical protein